MADVTKQNLDNAVQLIVSHVDERIGHVDEKIGHIDGRIGHVDEQIGHIDGRIGHVDERIGHIDERLTQTRVDLDNAVHLIISHVEQTRETLSHEIDEKNERLETRLLTAFHNWASPVARRITKGETDQAGLEQRMAMLEERMYDIERQRHKPE